MFVSHTGVLGAFEHWRNVDDAQLRAVADRGGCVGVIFCPRYLGADGIGAVVTHMKHILDVVGEDGPALGGDCGTASSSPREAWPTPAGCRS